MMFVVDEENDLMTKTNVPFSFHNNHSLHHGTPVIGKIALVISAIIGLKKLVAPEGHEKTTYEIVKHPHVQQSHSYSSSHGEFDNHDNGVGQYHRSFDEYDELMIKNPALRNNLSPKYN